MKLVPLGDRVILKPIAAEERTKSGILLSGAAKEKPQEAEVIAVGTGSAAEEKAAAGGPPPVSVAAGERVIYAKYAGTEVVLDGKTYMIVKRQDILAVVEE